MSSITESQLEQPQPPAPPPTREISGFWRRSLAFIIDFTFLGVVAFLLSILLGDFFAHLGVWGGLFGFCITVGYFGLLNSSIDHGQTIGKKIMRIEVVDKEGNSISLGRSFLRSAVLCFGLFPNWILNHF